MLVASKADLIAVWGVKAFIAISITLMTVAPFYAEVLLAVVKKIML
jgi:hypothetical protein